MLLLMHWRSQGWHSAVRRTSGEGRQRGNRRRRRRHCDSTSSSAALNSARPTAPTRKLLPAFKWTTITSRGHNLLNKQQWLCRAQSSAEKSSTRRLAATPDATLSCKRACYSQLCSSALPPLPPDASWSAAAAADSQPAILHCSELSVCPSVRLSRSSPPVRSTFVRSDLRQRKFIPAAVALHCVTQSAKDDDD